MFPLWVDEELLEQAPTSYEDDGTCIRIRIYGVDSWSSFQDVILEKALRQIIPTQRPYLRLVHISCQSSSEGDDWLVTFERTDR